MQAHRLNSRNWLVTFPPSWQCWQPQTGIHRNRQTSVKKIQTCTQLYDIATIPRAMLVQILNKSMPPGRPIVTHGGRLGSLLTRFCWWTFSPRILLRNLLTSPTSPSLTPPPSNTPINSRLSWYKYHNSALVLIMRNEKKILAQYWLVEWSRICPAVDLLLLQLPCILLVGWPHPPHLSVEENAWLNCFCDD